MLEDVGFENKTIQEVVLEQGLLTQAQLDQIFSFENMISEIAVEAYEETEVDRVS